MGFAVPLSSWFRGPLKQRVEDALLGGRLQETGYFDGRFLQRMLQQHQAATRDYTAPIWALLMFEGLCSQDARALACEASTRQRYCEFERPFPVLCPYLVLCHSSCGGHITASSSGRGSLT